MLGVFLSHFQPVELGTPLLVLAASEGLLLISLQQGWFSVLVVCM